MSLYYSPLSGWSAAQSVPVALQPGGGVSPQQLFYSDNGVGQLLLFESDNTGSVTYGAITYDPVNGWGNQVSLGLSGYLFAEGSASGYVHVVSANQDPSSSYSYFYTITSNFYDPASGWSGVLDVIPVLREIVGSLSFGVDDTIDFEINNNGEAVLAFSEKWDAAYRLKQFTPATGWQDEIVRPLPGSCIVDDDFYGEYIGITRLLPNEPHNFIDLEINDLGHWSVVSNVTAFGNSNFNMLLGSRFEPLTGWLEDEILYCPLANYGGGLAIDSTQVMNKFGTTFVMWSYIDDGEELGNSWILSNKVEMLKGVPPVADAGLDQTVTEGDEVTMDASLSSDVDNEIVAYQWAQLSGSAVNIANSDMAIATFIAPLVSADEVLSFELTVTDESGNQATDTIDVTVTNFSSTVLGVVLSSSSAGPLTVGDSLTLSAQGAGGTGGAYEYQFRYKSLDIENVSWTTLKNFDAVSSANWDTATLGGKYKLQARVREVGNETVIVKDSITVSVNSVSPLLDVLLSSDVIGPQLEGFSASLSALANNSAGAVEYRFEIKNTDIQPDWMLLSDYGASENLNWNSNGYLGKNKIRVYARRSGTLDLAVQDTITVWINPVDAVTSVLLSPSLFSPQPSGIGVTFNTNTTGGNGSVEYQFSVKNTEGLAEWVVQQNWSATASFVWDTTGIFGKQRVRVEARNAGSTDREVNDKMSYWLNDDNPLTSVDLQANQASPMVVGPSIALTAVPDGATNLYEYQFRLKGAHPTASWSVLRDFDSDPTFQVGSTSFVGKNKFQVRARNQGTLDQEVKDNETIWVNSLNAITDVALVGSDSSVVWGDTITFTMSFTGGDGSFYFSKELKNPGEGFSGNDYFRPSTTNSFDFDVGGMMPGTYRMRVQVINTETDKPVKSNSVKFTVNPNLDIGWQIGGENYDSIQNCTIYECPCAVIGGCFNGGVDTGVFGGGY